MTNTSNGLERFVRNCLHDLKPYIPGKPIDEVKRELGLDRVIKLASNENPIGASAASKEATRKLLDQSHIYPDGNCFELKQAIVKNLQVSMDQLIIGNGSDEIIKLLAEAFLNQGDEVIAPTPSFSEYWFAATVMNAYVTGVPLKDDFTYDIDAMIQAVTPKTKMIFLCSPNNPTGTYLSKTELETILNNIPSDIVVVMDEAYYEYATADDFATGIDYINSHRVVVLRTFSKAYGLAAYRVGFGIASKELIHYINRVREPFNVNSFAQVAATAAIADQKHVEDSRDIVEEGKKLLYNAFEELGLPYVPTQGNFVFVDTKKDSKDVFTKLLHRGVIVRSGDIFGQPTYIRVTFGTAEENEIFINELKEVLAEL
ncbi:histidinol-phosphate transaminase [Desulfuribacillus alkaliarsenatis]|uniref:Histidinol-phosphate aminotransferase n=1 Tax=Desulfuribacillus alkaliarsenatis TaxID=766136 RepID=A0A1E5G557_9FIRM|nr:histidinol-phosphate transaminase [Desulfuribacillus alkaliarsenatis]OEF98245.1 histidinol-phosphate transaminase [Desulfuribacillus alkaliarsenatis]